MSAMAVSHVEETVNVSGGDIHVMKGGQGKPLLILHDDMGTPGWTPFYDELAQRFTVYVPALPGYGKSERPAWMRNVRDMAIVQNWTLKALGIDSTHVAGLGIGAWVAAEMATMCQRQFERMILVAAMGIQPTKGEIADQCLISSEEYLKLGFHNQTAFTSTYGREPTDDQRESWELNREMTVRIAWKPYMFNQALPYLLPGVDTPTLVVWGREDRIAPLSCGERYKDALPNARLDVIEDCGHFVDIEKPKELAALINGFIPKS